MGPLFSAGHTVDIAIVCSDFEESYDFYARRLALPLHEDLIIPASLAVAAGLAPTGFRHVRLRAGSTLIKLMEIDPAPAPRVDGFHAGIRWLTLRVDNLTETVALLSRRGVPFLSGPLEGLAGWLACAQAPDGVILEFVQPYDAPDGSG